MKVGKSETRHVTSERLAAETKLLRIRSPHETPLRSPPGRGNPISSRAGPAKASGMTPSGPLLKRSLEPVARPGAPLSGAISRVGIFAFVDRKTPASDALGESRS